MIVPTLKLQCERHTAIRMTCRDFISIQSTFPEFMYELWNGMKKVQVNNISEIFKRTFVSTILGSR